MSVGHRGLLRIASIAVMFVGLVTPGWTRDIYSWSENVAIRGPSRITIAHAMWGRNYAYRATATHGVSDCSQGLYQAVRRFFHTRFILLLVFVERNGELQLMRKGRIKIYVHSRHWQYERGTRKRINSCTNIYGNLNVRHERHRIGANDIVCLCVAGWALFLHEE
jgi:hypothetical protein